MRLREQGQKFDHCNHETIHGTDFGFQFGVQELDNDLILRGHGLKLDHCDYVTEFRDLGMV